MSMKIEIWSDVSCPFCYLGKKILEKAIEDFGDNDSFHIEWKSFQLNPNLITNTDVSITKYLSEIKGYPVDQIKQMNHHLTKKGKDYSIDFEFDKIVVSNTYLAHHLIQFAKSKDKGNEAEERLFRAYFTEGKNLDDLQILLDLGSEIGLDSKELSEALNSKFFSKEIDEDIRESQEIGIRGVPFFVFDRKYAISGAQDSTVFQQTLKKSFSEWKEAHPEKISELIQGESCSLDSEKL